jgi:multicomponent Na+:H+ antiporter subunit B
VTLDAVDVAFTEAAVGAGISTVLMLGAMTLTRRSEKHATKLHVGPLLVTVGIGAALIYGTVDMPPFGSTDAPGFQHIFPEYIAGSRDDIQIPNIVTSILASYRGFDTLGETAVIFAAGIGVLFLLGSGRENQKESGRTESDKGEDA